MKLEKNKKYKLTYLKYGRVISEYFEFMATRGNRYYFYCQDSGIDLLISKDQFDEYSKNTENKLLNKNL